MDFRESSEFDTHLRRLVFSIISRITVPVSPLADIEDLMQCGILGALEAANEYEEDRGAFVSYAYGRIRGSIVDYLRKIDILPRTKRRELAIFVKQMEMDETEYGTASWTRVCNKLGWGERKAQEIFRSFEARHALSLSDPATENESGSRTWEEVIPNGEKGADEIADVHFASQAMGLLDPRSETIVKMYFLEEKTLREIGALFGFTEANASIIRTKAVGDMRQHFAE